MSSTTGKNREKLDRYYTPDDLADKLVHHLSYEIVPELEPHDVLEPSVGGGAFVRATQRHFGGHPECIGVDPDPDALGFSWCSAWVRSTFEDFDEPGHFDLIVGNPPFRHAQAHIEKGLSLLAPGGVLAFLLRLAMTEGKGRAAFWRDAPLRHITVLAERPSFTGGGTDSCAYGWFVFQQGWQGGRSVLPGWSWKTPKGKAA